MGSANETQYGLWRKRKGLPPVQFEPPGTTLKPPDSTAGAEESISDQEFDSGISTSIEHLTSTFGIDNLSPGLPVFIVPFPDKSDDTDWQLRFVRDEQGKTTTVEMETKTSVGSPYYSRLVLSPSDEFSFYESDRRGDKPKKYHSIYFQKSRKNISRREALEKAKQRVGTIVETHDSLPVFVA